MVNKFSDAEVYLAIKSAFVALKGLAENSLKKNSSSKGQATVKKSMDKIDAIIKTPRKTLESYMGGKKSVSDQIIDDLEGVWGAGSDHDLYVLFHNFSVYVDHWFTDGKDEKQAKKIIAESKRLNNILDLQNSNLLVRPFKKVAHMFQR